MLLYDVINDIEKIDSE